MKDSKNAPEQELALIGISLCSMRVFSKPVILGTNSTACWGYLIGCSSQTMLHQLRMYSAILQKSTGTFRQGSDYLSCARPVTAHSSTPPSTPDTNCSCLLGSRTGMRHPKSSPRAPGSNSPRRVPTVRSRRPAPEASANWRLRNNGAVAANKMDVISRSSAEL